MNTLSKGLVAVPRDAVEEAVVACDGIASLFAGLNEAASQEWRRIADRLRRAIESGNGYR